MKRKSNLLVTYSVCVCDITSFDMYDYNSGEEAEYGE